MQVENERLRREQARITEQRDILKKLRASFPKHRTGVFPSVCDESGTSVPDDVRGSGRLAQRALSMAKHVDLGEGHFTHHPSSTLSGFCPAPQNGWRSGRAVVQYPPFGRLPRVGTSRCGQVLSVARCWVPFRFFLAFCLPIRGNLDLLWTWG